MRGRLTHAYTLAEYPGHKLHIDQNENLFEYIVTYACGMMDTVRRYLDGVLCQLKIIF